MQEMVIYGVSFDMVGKSPIVLLKTAEGSRFLPIWIGHAEAAAILMKLQGQAAPRPMTHDLVTEMLAQLDANVSRVTVTELRESTFYALVTVRADGHEIEIDSRPSDAIALALRAEAPIFVAERVLEESGIEFDEGEESGELPPELPGELSDEHLALVERWREQLEGISSPEDFTEAASEEDDDLT